MTTVTLHTVELTAENFAPFGEVVEAGATDVSSMNDARFDRFNDLFSVDVDGAVSVGIVRAAQACSLPYMIDRVERHPLGSQAFIPLSRFRFPVVVARPGDAVAGSDLHAFMTNGEQGINYRRGTWHMPLIALAEQQRFLVIDRSDEAGNCDVQKLATPVQLTTL